MFGLYLQEEIQVYYYYDNYVLIIVIIIISSKIIDKRVVFICFCLNFYFELMRCFANYSAHVNLY